MGVDLTLMPLISQGFWVSHTHIQVMRRRDLWDAVTALGKTDVPEPVTCFFARNEGGDPTYGELAHMATD